MIKIRIFRIFYFIIFFSCNILIIIAKGVIPKCKTKKNTNIICSNFYSSTLDNSICKIGKNNYLVDDNGFIICKFRKNKELTHKKRLYVGRGEGSDEGKYKCDVESGNNCSSNTYYLINENGDISNNEGTVYYCVDDNKGVSCTKQNDIGYYVNNKDIIYTCKKNNGAIVCAKSSINNNVCNEENIGKLFLSESKIFICLNYNNKAYSIELSKNNAGEYVVYKSITSNELFGTNDENLYAVITINENSVLLNTEYSKNMKYVYVYKDENNESSIFKVMKKGDSCPRITEDSEDINENSILELQCNEGKCK